MERLTQKAPDSEMVWFKDKERLLEPCEMSTHESRLAIVKLADYEQAEEQGLQLRSPCKVGDTVYVIDRGEDNTLQVYEGKWKCVSLVQTSKDGPFNLRGEITYDIYDCFYMECMSDRKARKLEKLSFSHERKPKPCWQRD